MSRIGKSLFTNVKDHSSVQLWFVTIVLQREDKVGSKGVLQSWKVKKQEPQSSHVSSTVIQVEFVRDHLEKSGVDLKYSVLLAPRKETQLWLYNLQLGRWPKLKLTGQEKVVQKNWKTRKLHS